MIDPVDDRDVVLSPAVDPIERSVAGVDDVATAAADDRVVARTADDRVVAASRPGNPQMRSGPGVPSRLSASHVPTTVQLSTDVTSAARASPGVGKVSVFLDDQFHRGRPADRDRARRRSDPKTQVNTAVRADVERDSRLEREPTQGQLDRRHLTRSVGVHLLDGCARIVGSKEKTPDRPRNTPRHRRDAAGARSWCRSSKDSRCYFP